MKIGNLQGGFYDAPSGESHLAVKIPTRTVTTKNSFVAVLFSPDGEKVAELIGAASPAQLMEAAFYILEAATKMNEAIENKTKEAKSDD